MRIVRVIVVVAAVALGLLLAFGCVVAALFELDGFGRAGAPPRESYLLALAVGFAASLMVPMVVWRLLLPRAAPGLGLAAGLTAAALIATILGLSGRW